MEKEEYTVLAVSKNSDEHTAIIDELLEHNIRVECVETYMGCIHWLLDNDCQILVIVFPKLKREEFEFIRAVRRMRDYPILSVIYDESIENKKKMFEAGVDDYIIRPVVVEDFVIKVRSLIRRCQMFYNMKSGKERRTTLTFGDLIIDPMTRYVYLKGERIELRRREFLLLFALAKREGQVVSRETLRFTVWGDSYEGNIDNTIPVTINRIRKKLGKRKYIETVKGTGYRFIPYPDSDDGIEITQ